jgi:hypothetical protein
MLFCIFLMYFSLHFNLSWKTHIHLFVDGESMHYYPIPHLMLDKCAYHFVISGMFYKYSM